MSAATKQQVALDLREVVRIFILRMAKKPETYKFREEQSDFQRRPVVLGAELVFAKATPKQVKHVMEGLTPLNKVAKVKGHLTTHTASWKYEGAKFKFRVTLRVHDKGRASFQFTTIW